MPIVKNVEACTQPAIGDTKFSPEIQTSNNKKKTQPIQQHTYTKPTTAFKTEGNSYAAVTSQQPKTEIQIKTTNFINLRSNTTNDQHIY